MPLEIEFLLTKMLMEAAKTACLPSCIGDWRRAVGRKAGTDIGVNSCLVALIASETVNSTFMALIAILEQYCC